MAFQRYDLLTEEMRNATAPLAAALRRAGIEPTHAYFAPSWSGVRRRARQEKAKAYKRSRAQQRRQCVN